MLVNSERKRERETGRTKLTMVFLACIHSRKVGDADNALFSIISAKRFGGLLHDDR